MSKYHKLSKNERQLGQPLEYKLIKLSCLGLLAFLITVFAASALTPTQPSSATGQVLMSLQSTDSIVSLSTSAAPVNLSMAATATGAVRTAMDAVIVTSGSAGYQLYIGTSGDNNSLVRDGATTTSANPTTYADNDTISPVSATSLLSPANLSNDTWGFATLAQGSGAGSADVVTNGFDSEYTVGDNSNASNKFIAVPTHGNDLLIAKNTGAADAVTTNVYYGARATSAKPSGLYRNTVIYTAISNSSAASLASVSPNRTSQIQGGQTLTVITPSTLALSSIASTEVTISGVECTNATAIKSDDGTGAYTYATCLSPSLSTGWHEVSITFITTSGTAESYVVNPGIEYYVDAGGTELATYMQDFTVADCAQVSTNTTVILQDKRDNNMYKVTRLPDGNCWMTTNLMLGNTIINSGSIEINSENSDYGGEAFTITSDNISTEADNTWVDSTDSIQIYARASEEVDTNGNVYGNLYNWFAATAKSGTTSITSGNASSSICPKGWKLPPYSGNGSYATLFKTPTSNGGLGITGNETGANDIFLPSGAVGKAPYNFSFAGRIDATNSNDTAGVNITGRYYMRTAYNSEYAYTFHFGLSQAGVANRYSFDGYHPKFAGDSVRCVLENTMQNFDITSCSNLETAKTITLIDARDLNTYTVAKLADGNCWMTRNLRLGSSRTNTATPVAFTIDAANSDYGGASFTVSTSSIQTSGTSAWGYDEVHVYITGNSNKGNLYNWYTATAKSGTRTGVTGGKDAPYSICPSGWRLPSGGDKTVDDSYNKLFSVYGVTDSTAGVNILSASPLSFTITGYYNAGYFDGSLYGYYKTRTSATNNDNNMSMGFRLSADRVAAGHYSSNYGSAIRCVFNKQ